MAWTEESRKKAIETKRAKGVTNQYTKAETLGLAKPKCNSGGNWLGKKHSDESKKIISEKARASKHRRLRKGMVEYNGVMLDSSWELELAKRLDYLGIEWIRPEPIEWIDNSGKRRNYFPDFYLPKLDLYLDPKNPAAFNAQKEKIECLQKQIKNLKFLRTLEECKSFT